ncbi:MAG: NAD-dependent epimerase/dehydratase family protein [Rhodospirillales bacterium]
MLRHGRLHPTAPPRVVVLGASGFIGGAIVRRLQKENTPLLALGRKEVDLTSAAAAASLAGMLQPEDAFVVASAKAPCKNAAMMVDNIRMTAAVCDALSRQNVAHVVYISSDAVYADGPVPLTESSPTAPTSLHGAMHLARELMLTSVLGDTPFAILRPTLVYGAGDPHNGYGPNRFRRLANKGEPIILFGLGEERRDHVHVDDVAELTRLVLHHRSAGVLNIATGEVMSFRDIAEYAAKLSGRTVTIGASPRVGAMPHNGYRPFDARATRAAFPGFRYAPLTLGLARAQQDEYAR